MTEKQVFGAIVRGIGISFICNAIANLMNLAMVAFQMHGIGLELPRAFSSGVLGFALLWLAPNIVACCYSTTKQD